MSLIVPGILARILPGLLTGKTSALDQMINQLRQSALEVQQVATTLKSRSSSAAAASSNPYQQQGGNSFSPNQGIDPTSSMDPTQQQPLFPSSTAATTAATTGDLFILPNNITSKKMMQNLQLLAANSFNLVRVGIVVEILADSVWTILNHVVGVASTSNENNVFPSSSLLQARRAFASQAVLVGPLAHLWTLLTKRNAWMVSPSIHGKDILSWCEKLTTTIQQQQQQQRQQQSKNNNNNNKQTATSTSTTTSSIINTTNNSNNANSNNNTNKFGYFLSSDSKIPPLHRILFSDLVVSIWSLLQTVCTTIEAKVIAQHHANLMVEASEFFSQAVWYFLSSPTRAFARADDAATVTWCTIAISFIPMIDEHFANSHDVQTQLLFEHLGEVLSGRFIPEQISVIGAHLFAKFFQYPRVASVVSLNSSVAKLALEYLDKEVVNFSAQPVLCIVACIVAVATAPEDAMNPSGSPLLLAAYKQCVIDGLLRISDNPNSSSTSAQAGANDGNDNNTSAAAATNEADASLENNNDHRLSSGKQQQQHNTTDLQFFNSTGKAAAAMARLMVVCMIQQLDLRRQQAAVKKALAPWDHRFQIMSPEHVEEDEDREFLKHIFEWCSHALLEYPALPWYQFPSGLRLGVRNELQKTLITIFIDAADLVAVQSADGADMVAQALLSALTTTTSDSSSGNTNAQQEQQQQQQQYATTSTTTTTTSASSSSPTGIIRSVTTIISSAAPSLQQQKQQQQQQKSNRALDMGSYQRFLSVRANTIITIVEKIRRSLFSAIDAASPWGKLVPRRLYSETALAFYDVIALAFSSFAGDALAIKNNAAFIQSMLQVTKRLIPLAQPFCLASLESPTTVNQLIDRFEQSMKDVEVGNNNANNANNINKSNAFSNLTYKYLVASFTLSGMTDQQGIRVMPNEVFSHRWIPLLARTCAAIEADNATRSLLEVHCRNCCSALLRSRRTVCPPSLLSSKQFDSTPNNNNTSSSSTTTNPQSSSSSSISNTIVGGSTSSVAEAVGVSTSSVDTSSLYSGPVTTDEFIRHVQTFLAWVIRPVLTPAKSFVSRRLAGSNFASTFGACVMSVERLENEKDIFFIEKNTNTIIRNNNNNKNNNHNNLIRRKQDDGEVEEEQYEAAGSSIAVNIIAQAGAALLDQIRLQTPMIAERHHRDVFIDGSTRFAEGIATCISCLDGKVRSTVKHYVNLMLSSSTEIFPKEAKQMVVSTMIRSIGLSKYLRGEIREEVAMWVASHENKWMSNEHINSNGNNSNNNNGTRSVLKYQMSKL